MHMQRDLHPTVLSSLEGIVDQMVWFRENWYEEVLRQLRQGLAKCYVIAFDNRQGVQVTLTFDSTHDLCAAKLEFRRGNRSFFLI